MNYNVDAVLEWFGDTLFYMMGIESSKHFNLCT